MATTTNYSWTTPDDTALVKDGAAAIRSLGTAIDTTVYNNSLNVGGLTLLSTTSLSGSSTTISTINQTYKDLVIYGRGIYASAQLELAIRLNGDTGSNYAFQFIGAAGETAYANWSGGSTSGKIAWVDDASGYNNRTNFNMNIARYTESENRYVALQNYAYKDSNTLCSNGHVMYNSTTAISSITFLLPSGSFSGGTIYIYGVK